MVGMSKARAENRDLPKRFYKEVSVVPEGAAFLLQLDGKKLKTPAKNLLQVPDPKLAAAIAAEWDAQTTHIQTDLMPLTRLLHIALDRVPLDRLALLEQIVAYAETDLLCYRSPEADLAVRQAAAFDPIVAWVEHTHALTLGTTEGIMPIAQPTALLAKLRNVFATATDRELAALAMLVPLLGSALLVLALWEGRVTTEHALHAARLEEDYQAEKWGADEEAQAAWAAKVNDISAAAFFLTFK